RFGFVWAAMMAATAVANLVIALAFTPWWPLFIGVFPLASKAGLFAVHFATVQLIGRARRRAARAGCGRFHPSSRRKPGSREVANDDSGPSFRWGDVLFGVEAVGGVEDADREFGFVL